MLRRAAALMALLAVGWGLIRWAPRSYARARLLLHQRRCLRYVASPQRAVFDTDPARVAQLMKDPAFVIYRGAAFRRPPADLDAVETAVPPNVLAAPRAVIFLHAMRAAGRPERLVAVERIGAADQSAYFIPDYDILTRTIAPAGFSRPAVEVPLIFKVGVTDSRLPHNIRIFEGQPDPSDPSHFTIRYEAEGISHVVDGYLAADGRVNLKIRP